MVNVISGFSRIEAHSCAGAQLGEAGGDLPNPILKIEKKVP